MAARKYSAILYVAIVIALGATWGVFKVVDDARRDAATPTRAVLTATQHIPLGMALHPDVVQVEYWPEPLLPDQAFWVPDSVEGRVARVDIFPGEAIVAGRLAPVGTKAGLEAMIEPGKRAVSIRVDDVSAIAGMVQPNSRVDLMLTLQTAEQQRARLFMENMRILAMGSELQPGPDGRPIQASVATLEVTPTQAERLAVAVAQGRIALALRGYSDSDSTRTTGATTADVIASLRGEPVAAPPRPRTATTRPAPQQEPVPVQPETVRIAMPPQRPESLTIPVFRGREKSLTRFEIDSARRDSIRRDSIRRARRDTLPR
jgi:pilus assembly protein CpaB